MIESIKIAIFVSILGGISSGIGGVFTSIFNINNSKYVSILQQITAGIMTGIICFDMLPESFDIINIYLGILSVIIGIFIVYSVDNMVIKFNKKENNSKKLISLVIIFSMAFHNVIEGIAIGSSFSYSVTMGIAVVIGIILHDIPEGIVVGISNNIAGKNRIKNIINTSLVGIVTGIGAFFGKLIGNISNTFIGISLSIAAGVMLYIISCELIPEANKNYSTRKVNISYIVGIIISIIIIYM